MMLYWPIGICAFAVLLASIAAKRNRTAKARFLAQHPEGVSIASFSSEVQSFLAAGQHMRALRQFRKETGLGLKDAKEILETATS